MALDSTTLWYAICVSAVVIGTLQIAQYLINRDETSMLVWGAAKLTGAVGAALLAFRGLIPDLLSVTAGNALIVLAVSANAGGLISFNEGRVPKIAIVVPPIAMTIGYLAAPDIDANLALQTHLNGICVVGPLAWAAWRTHRANRVDFLAWRRVLALVLWLWVATMMTRMAASIWIPNATDPVGTSATHSVTGLMLMALVVMTGVVETLASREHVDHLLAETILRDPQTGAYNRSGLSARVDAMAGTEQEAAILLMDLDDFKSINDTHGHPAGDRLLVRFVEIARSHLRPTDVLARYGGDEFCAVLPSASAREGIARAESIRTGCADANRAEPVGFSVSIGVSAVWFGDATAFDLALSDADTALYAAKASGRDMVMLGPCAR